MADKDFYRRLIAELKLIADELSIHPSFNIKPGTYRALDIHKLFKMKDEDYLEHFRSLRTQWENEGGETDDVRATRTIKVDTFSCTLPRVHAFYQISQWQRFAGLSGKNVPTWTFHDKRDVVATTSITFDSKRTMSKLAAFIKQNNPKDRRYTTLSLSDGCLRGTICEFEYDDFLKRFNKRKIAGLQSYKSDSSGFQPKHEYKDLSFRIEAKDLKHLCGPCQISLYMDKVDTDNDYSLRHPRIVIENKSGWCVSSEVFEYTDQNLDKIFDEQFTPSYDEDYLPITSSGDSIVCQSSETQTASSANVAEGSCNIDTTYLEQDSTVTEDTGNTLMNQYKFSDPPTQNNPNQNKGIMLQRFIVVPNVSYGDDKISYHDPSAGNYPNERDHPLYGAELSGAPNDQISSPCKADGDETRRVSVLEQGLDAANVP